MRPTFFARLAALRELAGTLLLACGSLLATAQHAPITIPITTDKIIRR